MNILEEIQNCPVEWKELGEVVEFHRGNGLQKKDFVDEGKPVIHYGQIYTKYKFSTKTTASFTDDSVFCKLRKAKPNDIIMATTSENIEDVGKSIVWEGNEEIGISGDSYVLTTNQNSRYINYYFRTFQFQKQKERKVTGTKVIRINSKDMEKFLIPIPPLEIQEKIVQILDKFTEYVTELTSELTSRKKQYSFYRDKLLSFEDEVYQVEWKTLGEVAECLAGATPRTSNSSYWENGTIPWMSSGEVNKGFVYNTEKKITQEGYDSCSTKVVPRDTVVIALAGQGKTRGTVAITKVELCTNQSLCSIVSNDDINSHYLYYYLKGQYQKLRDISSGEGTRGGLNLKMIRDFRIPVPSLEIQSRIVQVLDNFDMVCNNLNIGLPKEIELRQKQYEYFRNKLLTFTAEGVYTDSTVQYRQDLIRLLNWVFGPIRVELGQIFNTKNGYTPTKTNLDNWRNGTIPWFRMEDIRENGGILSDSIQHITEGAVKGELFPANSIIIATSATIGYHALVTRKFLANQRFTCLLAKEGISGLFIPNFLYYYCFKLDEFCRKNTLQGNFATVDMTKFKKFKFIIPSIKRQREIISILDHFNTLTTSLSEGLPREIEQRQKQYEYWREQLFNFDL